MRFRKLIAHALLALAIGGCTNRVYTNAPMFSEDASDGAPTTRDGTWANYALIANRAAKCRLRRTLAPYRVPICPQFTYRNGIHVLSPVDPGEHKRIYSDWNIEHEIMAAGDPLIVQTDNCRLMENEAAATRAPDEGVPMPATEQDRPEPPRHKYCYFGAKVLKQDKDGQIVAMEVWPVLCGPLPAAGTGANVTDRPWPGVTITNENCTVVEVAALRQAARLSHDVALGSGEIVHAYWLHDGFR